VEKKKRRGKRGDDERELGIYPGGRAKVLQN